MIEYNANPHHALMQYLDDARLDLDYVRTLLDQIVAADAEKVRDRLVKQVYAQMYTDPNAREAIRYRFGWNDATQGAVDTIKGAYVHTCGQCKQPIGYLQSPGADWWAHETHPADEHAAWPVNLR